MPNTTTMSACVTDETRLVLQDDYPIVDNENTGLRKAGQTKLVIPAGNLARYVPEWLAQSGVLRHLLDRLTAEEGEAMFESFAHPDEQTTEARQVRLEGQAQIKNQREQWLEKRAVALLVRAFPDLYGDADEDPDAVLTHAGFRNGECNPNLPGARQAFILRLVGLQLLIRRGVEVSQLLETQQGEQRFPLYGYESVEDYNTGSWSHDLADAEPPGTVIKQTLSKEQQRNNKRLREPMVYNGDSEKGPDFRRLYEDLKDKYEQRTEFDINHHAAKKHKKDHRESRPVHPNMPTHTPCHTTLGKTRAGPLSLDDADAILERPEVDPHDCVDARVIPEIVNKFSINATITAGCIHGLMCPQDQRQTMSVVDSTDGNGFTIATGTTSTRKISNTHDLLAVNDAFIDSVASVQPALGVKLRQTFPRTLHRAQRRFDGDIPKTIACWDRHIAGWMKGFITGANVSLACSKGHADHIDEEMSATRADTKRDDAHAAQVKQLQRQHSKLQRQLGGNNSNGSGGSGGGGGGGSGRPAMTKFTGNASDQDCVNFLAGRECKMLDRDGKCIFRHEGLVKGSDPDAIAKRYAKAKPA